MCGKCDLFILTCANDWRFPLSVLGNLVLYVFGVGCVVDIVSCTGFLGIETGALGLVVSSVTVSDCCVARCRMKSRRR